MKLPSLRALPKTKKKQQIPLPPIHRARKRPQKLNIIGEPKSNARILNTPSRIEKLKQEFASRDRALKRLAADREVRAVKRRKIEKEKEAKLKKKQEWATRVQTITPILIRKGFTKEGKTSSVPQIRNYLKKEKKLKGGELKAITVDNVMEKWLEYVND